MSPAGASEIARATRPQPDAAVKDMGGIYQHFINASLLERRGDYAKALKEYNQILQLDPESSLIYRLRSHLHLKMGYPEKALADAQTYVIANPEDVEAKILLSNIHLVLGQRAAARLVLEKILADNPAHSEAVYALAALLTSDDPAAAVPLWEKFIALNGSSVEGYYNLGMVYQKLEQPEKSREMFEKVIRLDREALPSLVLLGQMSEKKGDTAAAADYYEKALEKMPENYALRMQVVLLHAQRKEIGRIEKLLEPYRDDPEAPLEANLWLGILHENRKEWDKAVPFYLRAQKQVRTAEIGLRLANLYSQMDDTENAVKSLQEVLEMDPENPQLHYLLGLAYSDLKKHRQAVREQRKALELKPDFSQAYFQLGVSLDNLKKWPEAEKMFLKAIEIDSTSAPAMNYLGYTYADRNQNLFKARQLVEKALEIEQGNPAYLDSLGWVLFREGRFQDALKLLQSASEQMPDPVIYEHMGDCRLALKDFSAAADSYAKSLELDPENKKVRKKLEALHTRLVPTSPARKILKQFEYNLSRAASVSGMLTFENNSLLASALFSGSARAVFYLRKDAGVLNFSTAALAQPPAPTQLRVDILDALMTPAVTLRYRNLPRLQWTIFPPELKNRMPDETETLLDAIASLFNGKVLALFDKPETEVKETSRSFLLTNGSDRMRLEKKDSLISEIEVDGRRMEIKKFARVDGVWVPQTIVYGWKHAAPGARPRTVEIRIEFSGLSLKTLENRVFEIQQGKIAE